MTGLPDLALRTAARATRLAGTSRKRFLLSAGGMLGALSLAGTRADRAGATEVLGYYGTPPNATGTYAPVGRSHYLASDRPEVLSWGFLPDREAEPVMTVRSGDLVTTEQISHEGILEDQESPYEFFASWDIPEADILDDQLMVFEEIEHKGEGPHVATGPVVADGAEPGEYLEVRCLQIVPRVYYGVNSARRGELRPPRQ